MPLELILLHFSLLHSCRSIQTIITNRPSIYRRAPTMLQLQHLLQYQRSLSTCVAVIALALVAMPAAATKWELLSCISDPSAFAICCCNTSAVASEIKTPVVSVAVQRRPVLLLLQHPLQCLLTQPKSQVSTFIGCLQS
jgi:hypothetical protein